MGQPIDVAFIGSCTNGRISDLRAAADIARGRKVNSRVRALVVPGSKQVARQGPPTGRTLLMSPAMVAAAAVSGKVVDVREFREEHGIQQLHFLLQKKILVLK